MPLTSQVTSPLLKERMVCLGARIYTNEKGLRVSDNVLNQRPEELGRIAQSISLSCSEGFLEEEGLGLTIKGDKIGKRKENRSRSRQAEKRNETT